MKSEKNLILFVLSMICASAGIGLLVFVKTTPQSQDFALVMFALITVSGFLGMLITADKLSEDIDEYLRNKPKKSKIPPPEVYVQDGTKSIRLPIQTGQNYDKLI